MRVGVIGAGVIGQDHIRRLTDVTTDAKIAVYPYMLRRLPLDQR